MDMAFEPRKRSRADSWRLIMRHHREHYVGGCWGLPRGLISYEGSSGESLGNIGQRQPIKQALRFVKVAAPCLSQRMVYEKHRSYPTA